MCPQNRFFGFHSAKYGFFERKTLKQYSVFHFPRKRFYSFLSSGAPFLQKRSCPPKIIFHCYFGEIFFFSKNCWIKNYSEPHFLQKRLYLFLSPDASFFSKQLCPPTIGFSQFFPKMLFFFENLFNNKISGTYSKYLIHDEKYYINVLRKMPPFLKKWSNAPPKQFLAISSNTTSPEKNCLTWK